MKVLHVTEELSKRNYSISSLIFFLSDYLFKHIKCTYKVLASDIQKDIFTYDEKIKIIPYKKINDLFDQNKELENTIQEFNIIHIHGLWRAINLLTIYYCLKQTKLFYVHPHGMLLNAALKNKGLINYYLKIIFLKIINFIYGEKINFISITQLETTSIKKFFPKSLIEFIPNPVPLELQEQSNVIHKKRFVYFGRIHPIKNIDLVIQGFIKANLNKEWSLEIYGIPDDETYLKKIKKISQDHQNIFIKQPVFGDEKKDILQSSWANVLLSDSEVLSLSVLESASLSLPSLVNKEIQIDEFAKNEGVITSLAISSVASNIKEISNWNDEKRILKGNKLKEFVSKNYGIKNIFKKYIPIYEKTTTFFDDFSTIEKKVSHQTIKFFFDNSFLQIALSYVLNLMIPTLLMLFLTFNHREALAADIAIVSSVFITLTQIFSSNMRAQIISTNNTALAKDAILFRILFSLCALGMLIFIYDMQSFIHTENYNILLVLCLLILCQWIFEIALTLEELENKFSTFIFYNIVNLFLCFIHILLIVYSFKYLLLSMIIHFIFIFVFTFSKLKINEIKLNLRILTTSILKNIKTLAFLSSLSIIFSSLIWRVIIYGLFDKKIAAVYFASFALGSFPGTTFNLAIGPTYVKQNIDLSKSIKIFLSILFFIISFLCILSTILIYNNINLSIPNNYFIFYTMMFSLLGSFFMTYAMHQRQKSVQSTYQSRTNVFIFDIIYGTLIACLCPALYLIGGEYFTSLTFFLAAVSALIIYTFINSIKKQ